jgi:hypothetical protein
MCWRQYDHLTGIHWIPRWPRFPRLVEREPSDETEASTVMYTSTTSTTSAHHYINYINYFYSVTFTHHFDMSSYINYFYSILRGVQGGLLRQLLLQITESRNYCKKQNLKTSDWWERGVESGGERGHKTTETKWKVEAFQCLPLKLQPSTAFPREKKWRGGSFIMWLA